MAAQTLHKKDGGRFHWWVSAGYRPKVWRVLLYHPAFGDGRTCGDGPVCRGEADVEGERASVEAHAGGGWKPPGGRPCHSALLDSVLELVVR